MKTFQDLQAAGESEKSRIDFVLNAISDHKASQAYTTALDAEMYASGKNATISKYQKILYKMTGEAVPDNYTANHKCKSGFFKRFITQEASFEVGNGVTFEKSETKDRLGKKIDSILYFGVKKALIQGAAFGFFNLDHVEIYQLLNFVPLYDEETGSLRAGIRFWQLDNNKPLRATLFEEDGYTDYAKSNNAKEMTVYREKRSYTQIVTYSEADGETITDGANYPGFPIVPLYGNAEHQSELLGKREQIDCYDLIKSGFANDLDDASMIYWTLKNAGGMDDVDLAQFIERMKIVHASNIPGADDAQAEAHTVEVPYQSRETYLTRLEKDLYKDFMALDVEKIAAGATTATQIRAAYEPLNEKCDELEMCLCEFFDGIFAVAGIEDEPSFERSMISNQTEFTQMVLSAAEYLDDETVLRKLPFLTADEIDGVLKRKDAEEMSRFNQMEKELEGLKKEKQEGGEGE